MAETITFRTDADVEHALEVLTRDGENRLEAVRRVILAEAKRREHMAAAWEAFLTRPLASPDGRSAAEEIIREREEDWR